MFEQFPPNSRYHGIETKTHRTPDGRAVTYLARRFVPLPQNLSLLQEHVVTEDDRLDLIAASTLGDPLLFWRICDANHALRPEALTEEIGRRLRITMPETLSTP